jgi:magnesium chelatase family protein
MNPCACGNFGEPGIACSCSAAQVQNYRARVSGPVLDRIDLAVRVPFVPYEHRHASPAELSSARVRARVAAARRLARERNGGALNADVPPGELEAVARLDRASRDWLGTTIDRLRLSMRAHHRLLRVARTLADLDEAVEIDRLQLARALSFREADRA